jgi:hypothetical protein
MMKRKPKETTIEVCPKCGCKSWVSTTMGTMCKDCKYIQSESTLMGEAIKE